MNSDSVEIVNNLLGLDLGLTTAQDYFKGWQRDPEDGEYDITVATPRMSGYTTNEQ